MILIFKTKNDYNTYTSDGTKLKSGILYYVKEDGSVHFFTNNIDGEAQIYDGYDKAQEDKKITAIFNVTDISEPTRILGQPDPDPEMLLGSSGTRSSNSVFGLESIEVDGVTLSAIDYTYQFTSTGQHEIKYTLTDSTTPPDYMFYNCGDLQTLVLGNEVETTGSYFCKGTRGLTSITLPDTLTAIGEYAFQYCSALTSITIPDTVITIGRDSFKSSGLTSITIPDTVTNIGRSVFEGCSDLVSATLPSQITELPLGLFSGCSSLTTITIPNTVTKLGGSCFNGCSDLTSITIPNGVTIIDNKCFNMCTSLTNVTLPNSLTRINDQAFCNCNSFTSITIPKNVTNIGYSILQECINLTSITVDAENTVYDSRNNCNAIIEKSIPELIQGCKTSTIPNTVYRIGYYAFYHCSGLTSITIPTSVGVIDTYAFMGTGLSEIELSDSIYNIEGSAFRSCTNLETVRVNNENPPTLGTNVFDGNKSGRKIIVPSASVNTYKAASGWSAYANDIEADDPSAKYLTFTAKEDATFGFSSNGLSYSTDKGSTWTSLPSTDSTPTIHNGDTIIWKGQMTGNQSNGIGTFTATGNFDISGNIMSLLYGDNFVGQTNLNYNNVFKQMFYNNTKLKSAADLILPAMTLTPYCYDSMFMGCTGLTTAPNLPATSDVVSGYSYVYQNMFKGCSSLTNIPASIPLIVSKQGSLGGMFRDCTSLTTLPTLPSTSVPAGGYQEMFMGCTSITTIPNNYLQATSVALQAYMDMFNGCTSLTSVPSDLIKNVGNTRTYARMFANCTSLTTAPIIPNIGFDTKFEEMFRGCTNLNYIKVMINSFSNGSTNWVNGVANSGSFILGNNNVNWNNTPIQFGPNYVPYNWTIYDDNGNVITPKQIIRSITWNGTTIDKEIFELNSVVNITCDYKTNPVGTGPHNAVTMYYSTDNVNWTTTMPTTIDTSTAGAYTMYFKCEVKNNPTYYDITQTFTFTYFVREALDLDLSHYTRLDLIDPTKYQTNDTLFNDVIFDCSEALTNGNSVSVILKNMRTGQTHYTNNRIQTATNISNITWNNTSYKFQTNGTELTNNPGFYAFQFGDDMQIWTVDSNVVQTKIYFKIPTT